MTRRDFVRYAVGGAAVGTASIVGVQSYFDSRRSVDAVDYVGAELRGGPGYNGLPLVPVRVRDDGVLEGVPEPRLMAAYRYCGMQGAPGLQAGYDGDDVLRYDELEGYLELADDRGIDLWYRGKIGEPVHASDFPELLAGAPARWRSEGQTGQNVVRLLVLHVHESTYPRSVQDRFAPDGFVGLTAACTHLCCTAGYRRSEVARERGAWDHVFCDCHFAHWDPLAVRRYRMPASGRPSDGEQQQGMPIVG